MPTLSSPLPSVPEQAERLIELGVHEIAGLSADRVRNAVPHSVDVPAVLVVRHDIAPVSRLAPLLSRAGKPGFVVSDMSDVDDFAPIPSIGLPTGPLYLVYDLDRGDEMANWSPDEALPAILDSGRTPLTLTEGVHWLLQRPEVLERGRCFMTIGSRLTKISGRAGRQDTRAMDQQRHRPGRKGEPRRAEGRLVLGRQPTHVARLRFGPRQDHCRRVTSDLTPCAASTNGSTVASHAVGSDENTTCPVGNDSNVDLGIASATFLPQRTGALGSLAPHVISTGAMIIDARSRRSCSGSVKLFHSAAAVFAPAAVLARSTTRLTTALSEGVFGCM